MKILRRLDNALLSRRATPAECVELYDATNAIAELIAADEEYDAATKALLDPDRDDHKNLVRRLDAAIVCRAAALLACKGQGHER